MAGDIAIRAEGLGKKYVIRHQAGNAGLTFRELIARKLGSATGAANKLFGGGRNAAANGVEEFWALRDVDFEIRRGDVVGIVGRNGAGKSTLLKILSRITDPTQGRVEIRGRVGSLLEVGTGFHPDLTGRENVFLNGAILGMSRAEIRRKFDEIVDFAGIDRFIDTPVKRYSSGMYVRLAFGVAAHLEPEILIVDEVLAVGDAEFQRKCLGKMHDVAGLGRTVLFVSHNMAAVERLCTRALFLDGGNVKTDGSVRHVLGQYLSRAEIEVLEYIPEPDPTRIAELRRITLSDQNGHPLRQITTADAPILNIEVVIRKGRPDLRLAFALYDALQTPIFASCPPDDGIGHPTEPGIYRYQAAIPGPLFMAQRYSVTVALYSSTTGDLHSCQHALSFDVIPAHSHIYSTDPNRVGTLQVLCRWNVRGDVVSITDFRETESASCVNVAPEMDECRVSDP
jgi:lipopolysaccharide transport system ATP-binding protein